MYSIRSQIGEQKTRKGISPLIAAVLLIAFTMSIALLAGPFFTNTIQDTQQGQMDEAKNILDSSKAFLEVQDIKYDTQSGNYTFKIKNTGSVALTNFTVTTTGEEASRRRITETLQPGEIGRYEIATNNKTSESELMISAENTQTQTSQSLENIKSGVAPSAPSGLTGTYNEN